MIPSPLRPVPYSAKTERQAFNRTLAITAELLRPRSGPVFCDRCDRQEIDCGCGGVTAFEEQSR
jgi:hypothetical protein